MEGNQQKMREAMVTIRQQLQTLDTYGEIAKEAYLTIVGCIDDALASPPRQCDVGTPEEQVRRYKLFCENHSGWDGQKRFGCLNCPFIDVDECEFAWAQMPYEAQEGAGE